MSDAIRAFVDQATQFCEFIDTPNSLSLPEKLQHLSALLAKLYVAAIHLPDVEPTERDVDAVIQRPQVSFGDIDGYWEVFDPYEADKPIMASLTDDITDIYADLKKGLSMYQSGTEDDIIDAVWQWKTDFETHWGFHLVNAFRAMHLAVHRMSD